MKDVTWTNSDSISDVQGYPVNSSMGGYSETQQSLQ